MNRIASQPRLARPSHGRFWPVLLSVLAALSLAGCQDKPAPSALAPEVEVLAATPRDVPIHYEWVASLDGMVNATIRAQVQGYLIKRNYQEGSLVKKGQVLFEIDPRTFQAALNQALANLAQEKALWETAQSNLKRIRPLAAQKAVSQKDLDEALGSEQSREATVQAAQAAVDKARLDLGFTKIISPIDGVAGIAKAQIGDLVGPGSTEELTTVSTVNPIKVFVGISERDYLQAFETSQGGKEEARLPLDLILANGNLYPHKGHFIFADRQVDPGTGTIKVAALFPNPDNYLRPGMFARVRVLLEMRRGAIVIPQRAVSEVQGRFLVAVVGADDKVDIRPVRVGERIKSDWVIEEGIKPGERVVVEGAMKARQGQAVRPKPFTPSPSHTAPASERG